MWFDRQLDDLVINGFLAQATQGQTFYLDNSNTPKPNLKGMTRCFTLASALAACTSYQGDQIIVAPDHDETFTADTAITKHGVQIIGMRRGTRRPRLRWNTVGAELQLSADDVTLRGIDFSSNRAAGGGNRFLTIAGHRAVISNCRFYSGSRSDSPTKFIYNVDTSVTDLACADGDLAAPVVTSATYTFTSRDVGRLLHVTAGTGLTTGIYTIVSVSAGAATLDRAVGTDGAKTSGSASISTADDVLIENCDFSYEVATPVSASAIEIAGTVTNWTITGCNFYGDWSVSCISQTTLLAINLRIVRNEFNNIGTDNVAGGIDLLAGTTGYVDWNDVFHDNGTANTGIDFGGCHLGPNNFISDDIAKKGKSFGTAAT